MYIYILVLIMELAALNHVNIIHVKDNIMHFYSFMCLQSFKITF